MRALVQQRLTRGRVEIVMLGSRSTAPPAREVVLDEALLEQVVGALEAARARGPGHRRRSRRPTCCGFRRCSTSGRRRPTVGRRARGAWPAWSSAVVAEALDAPDRHARDRGPLPRDRSRRPARDARRARRRRSSARRATGRRRSRRGCASGSPRCRRTCRATRSASRRRSCGSSRGRTSTRKSSGCAGTSSTGGRSPTGPEPCGRKLDFLVQEMNREINTIGSKAEGARATEIVIAAKAELERVREQVQNVE